LARECGMPDDGPWSLELEWKDPCRFNLCGSNETWVWRHRAQSIGQVDKGKTWTAQIFSSTSGLEFLCSLCWRHSFSVACVPATRGTRASDICDPCSPLVEFTGETARGSRLRDDVALMNCKEVDPPRQVTYAAALKRSKRSARRSRSGRSLLRFGRWIAPPSRCLRASSIGPSFCINNRSDTCSR
jgi:hypothetical protein